MSASYMAEANAIAAALRKQPAPASRRPAQPTTANLAVLAFMREFFADNDQLPPVAVVARHFGWSGMSAVQHHVSALMHHGLVERNAVGKLRFTRTGAKARP